MGSVLEILAPIVIIALLALFGLYFGCKFLEEGSSFDNQKQRAREK